MKLYLSIVVFCLLQLGGLATPDVENTQEVQENEDQDERELRPFGYPAPRQRPGQRYKYGLNSLVGFRPYQNPNGFVSQTQQDGLTEDFAIPVNQPANLRGPPKFTKSGKITKAWKAQANRARFNPGFVPTPSPVPNVIGIQRVPGSLAQALGFYRVEQGTDIVFDARDNEDIQFPTFAPTDSQVPTAPVTQSPTRQPTINPTQKPTEFPTKEPTPQPTLSPTPEPSAKPTKEPTSEPTNKPTKEPTNEPTNKPTNEPTPSP